MTPSYTALITDGDERSSLAIVRSLGRAGFRCVVASPSGKSIAGASKYCALELFVPEPLGSPEAYQRALAVAVADHDVDLLVPVTEASLLALLQIRNELTCTVPFPAPDVFQAVSDKAKVVEAARALGIRVPRQHSLTLPGGNVPSISLPAVVKPARSICTTSDGRRQKTSVQWVHDEAELAAAVDAYPEAAYPLLIQEAVEGAGVGIFVLLWDGELVAAFAHRRLREKPPSGGVSVLRESIPVDQALLERSLALLRTFDWTGVCMVEYKIDRHTGEPVIMEINGRFWGSLQLAIDAGVDFPRLLAEAVLDGKVAPRAPYHHVRTRWLWGDVDHLIARWRDPGTSWGGRLVTALDWLRAFRPGTRTEVFRWSDPRPFLRETGQWIASVAPR